MKKVTNRLNKFCASALYKVVPKDKLSADIAGGMKAKTEATSVQAKTNEEKKDSLGGKGGCQPEVKGQGMKNNDPDILMQGDPGETIVKKNLRKSL